MRNPFKPNPVDYLQMKEMTESLALINEILEALLKDRETIIKQLERDKVTNPALLQMSTYNAISAVVRLAGEQIRGLHHLEMSSRRLERLTGQLKWMTIILVFSTILLTVATFLLVLT